MQLEQFFSGVAVQWCLFHVARAWIGKICELVKLGSSTVNAQVHKSLMTALKKMMWERNKATFLDMLHEFVIQFIMYSEFLNYFKKNYLEDDKFIHWSAVYQPQIFTNMETNNYVESWHNQLKSIYLQRNVLKETSCFSSVSIWKQRSSKTVSSPFTKSLF